MRKNVQAQQCPSFRARLFWSIFIVSRSRNTILSFQYWSASKLTLASSGVMRWTAKRPLVSYTRRKCSAVFSMLITSDKKNVSVKESAKNKGIGRCVPSFQKRKEAHTALALHDFDFWCVASSDLRTGFDSSEIWSAKHGTPQRQKAARVTIQVKRPKQVRAHLGNTGSKWRQLHNGNGPGWFQ